MKKEKAKLVEVIAGSKLDPCVNDRRRLYKGIIDLFRGVESQR